MVLLRNFLSVIFLSLIIIFLLDSRVEVSGVDKSFLKSSIFREFYSVRYKNPLRFFLKPKFSYVTTNTDQGIVIEEAKNGLVVSGKTKQEFIDINIKSVNKDFFRKLTFVNNLSDSDEDGFFDLVELDSSGDKESFINWFTSIAKSQFYKTSDNWDIIHQDCAGLVTYAYKEALKSHDLTWLQQYYELEEQKDVEKYNYPNIPIIGDECFNSAFGFTSGANASTLLNYNLNFISKNIKDLQKGDILFYYDEKYEMPYHSMIYMGESGYVVYHTGPIDEENNGEVRMVLLSDLFKHPDTKWYPKESNNMFLGGYRWRILM